jgi:hypothetical protein
MSPSTGHFLVLPVTWPHSKASSGVYKRLFVRRGFLNSYSRRTSRPSSGIAGQLDKITIRMIQHQCVPAVPRVDRHSQTMSTCLEILPYVDVNGVALLTVDCEDNWHFTSSSERCGNLHVELVEAGEFVLRTSKQNRRIYAADGRPDIRDTAVFPQARAEEEDNYRVCRRAQIDRSWRAGASRTLEYGHITLRAVSRPAYSYRSRD